MDDPILSQLFSSATIVTMKFFSILALLFSSVASQVCDEDGSFTVSSVTQPWSTGCYRVNNWGYATTEFVQDGYKTLWFSKSGDGGHYLVSFHIGNVESGQRVHCKSKWFETFGGSGTVAELGDSVAWDYCFYPSSSIESKDLRHDDITVSCGCNGKNLYGWDNGDTDSNENDSGDYNRNEEDLFNEENESSSTGAIVGGVLGSVIGVALIAGVVVYMVKRRRRINAVYAESARIRANLPPTLQIVV